VVDLLQRVGGLSPGAAPADVYLIRSHLVDGGTPEVFHIDLQAIFAKHDQRTNVLVQPFDQINVGESRRSNLSRSMPPVLLPLYQSLFGLQQPPS
jgi:protein involved in polysaccharide export with SLBB domain